MTGAAARRKLSKLRALPSSSTSNPAKSFCSLCALKAANTALLRFSSRMNPLSGFPHLTDSLTALSTASFKAV